MTDSLQTAIVAALDTPIKSVHPLGGGMVGQVYRVALVDGRQIVAKAATPEAHLEREGYMLRYLAEHSHLPVPAVLYSSEMLLLMAYVEGNSAFTPAVEQHAAALLADLHGITAPAYGLEQATLIGGLHQPNPWTDSWVDFFRDQRLRYMAGVAHRAGRLPDTLLRRIETFAQNLGQWLIEPERPALLHGDVWTTNVLAAGGRITAFIDPAIYYGHPEIELAFITLFNTFGTAFFEHYAALHPISPGFWEERRDIYNLYPLLVHVRLFGGGYVGGVDRTLRRFGY
ncbi:MAG: fructosamine kinase family protein [Anaerolineaceae bacterium]|nr:fructosamine kinase family protein [Anaerolineaceae bacterium]